MTNEPTRRTEEAKVTIPAEVTKRIYEFLSSAIDRGFSFPGRFILTYADGRSLSGRVYVDAENDLIFEPYVAGILRGPARATFPVEFELAEESNPTGEHAKVIFFEGPPHSQMTH